MSERWEVTFNRAMCVGTGLCAVTAPGGIELDEGGRGRAKETRLPPDEDVRDAAESCPVEAIRIAVEGTGEMIFPPA